jgi:hypothetical protein
MSKRAVSTRQGRRTRPFLSAFQEKEISIKQLILSEDNEPSLGSGDLISSFHAGSFHLDRDARHSKLSICGATPSNTTLVDLW